MALGLPCPLMMHFHSAVLTFRASLRIVSLNGGAPKSSSGPTGDCLPLAVPPNDVAEGDDASAPPPPLADLIVDVPAPVEARLPAPP